MKTFLRRHWKFLLVSLAVMTWAGTKPTVLYPTGITDDGSCFDTNGWQWVEFRWKTSAGYPPDWPVLIDAAVAGGAETNWFAIAEATAGELTNRVSASVLSGNPTNFIYRITSDYTPAVVEIKDFSAFTLETNMAVVCSWTCPTNLVGLVGQVQYRKVSVANAPWVVAKTHVMQLHNEVTVVGNFVGGRIDREFRVVVDGYTPISMRNRTSFQVDLWILQRCIIDEAVFRTVTRPLRLGFPGLRHVEMNFKTGVWM